MENYDAEGVMEVQARLESVRRLRASLELGDSGVGGRPVDGQFALLTSGDSQRDSLLSNTALRAAEDAWTGRADPGRMSDSEAFGALRAAVDVEAALWGLRVHWAGAQYTADPLVVWVEAAAAPDVAARERSPRFTGVLSVEIVDDRATDATWAVIDASGDRTGEQQVNLVAFQTDNFPGLCAAAEETWLQQAAAHDWVVHGEISMYRYRHPYEAGSSGSIELRGPIL